MRTDVSWIKTTGNYIYPNHPTGYDVLIYGTNKYLNFNAISGTTGYGFRDNNGVMEVKNSGGSWQTFIGSTGFFDLDQTTSQTIINGQPIRDTLTASQLLATDANKKMQSLVVATYPSLTEISYVKGVTSAIQTQLDTKWTKNGDTLGVKKTIGSIDNYDIGFITNNVERLTITNTGGILITGMTTGSIPFFGTDGLISQDNTNFFWDDTNNRLGVGTNSLPSSTLIKLYITQDDVASGYRGFVIDGYADSIFGNLIIMRKGRGTRALPTATLSGDSLGIIAFKGYGATGFIDGGAEIRSFATENYTDTAQGGDLRFIVASNAGTSMAEAMRINHNRNIGIGLSDPQNKLDVLGTVTTDQINLRSARAAIVSSDILGGISFTSDDTSLAAPGTVVAQFRAVATATHTATVLDTDFVWRTTKGTTLAEVMNLTAGGSLVVKTQAIAGAETLLKLTVSDDANSNVSITNATNGGGAFSPWLTGTGSGTGIPIIYGGIATTDTGANPIIRFDARLTPAAVVVTRPIFVWYNYTTEVMRMTAGGFLGIGTTSPAARLHTGGAISAASWTTSGIALRIDGATYTDTSTAGSSTIAQQFVNVFGLPTIAATNTLITITDASTLYIAGRPSAGTNVTITNPWALHVLTKVLFESTALAGDMLTFRSARAAVIGGSIIGGIDYISNDTDLASPGSQVAYFRAIGSGTHSSGSLGTDFVWAVVGTSTDTVVERMRLRGFSTTVGGLGINVTPAAQLHLGAGTATANTAPLKFTSGTNLTAAVAGAVEFTTDDLFFTITTGAARKNITLWDTLGTTGRIPYATTNGRLTDSGLNGSATSTTTAYDIEITDTTKGIILKSPNATRWRITVDNTGALIVTSL